MKKHNPFTRKKRAAQSLQEANPTYTEADQIFDDMQDDSETITQEEISEQEETSEDIKKLGPSAGILSEISPYADDKEYADEGSTSHFQEMGPSASDQSLSSTASSEETSISAPSISKKFKRGGSIKEVFKRGNTPENFTLDFLENFLELMEDVEMRIAIIKSKAELFPKNRRFREPTINPQEMDLQSYEHYLRVINEETIPAAYGIIAKFSREALGDPETPKNLAKLRSGYTQDKQAFISFNLVPLKILEEAIAIKESKLAALAPVMGGSLGVQGSTEELTSSTEAKRKTNRIKQGIKKLTTKFGSRKRNTEAPSDEEPKKKRFSFSLRKKKS